MLERTFDSLEDLLCRPEGTWSLLDGALAVAKELTPAFHPESTLRRLDDWGQRVRQLIGEARHPRFVAAGVSRVLFEDAGLNPQVPGRERPEGALLPAVVEGGSGIPVLLALVFVEVARRAGHRFEILDVPGGALVRADFGSKLFLFDPSRNGMPVALDEFRHRVAQLMGEKVEFRENWLRPIGPVQVLARLIGALKILSWRAGEHERALTAIRQLLLIKPEDPRELRDSGRLLFLLGRLPEAVRAFETYLDRNPHGDDAEVVRMLLTEARASLYL